MSAPRLPSGAWDSHIHVLDTKNFVMKDDRPFTPKAAPVEDALAFEKSLGIDHVCIIASSIYGQDNSCLAESLRLLQGKARGIAYIDPATISDEELDRLHAAGVRGVRLNLWTTGKSFGASEWESVLTKYAQRLKRNDWVLQVYASMEQFVHAAPILPKLGVKVVIDHLGCPNPGTIVSEQTGCRELYDLLRSSRNVYIKISGAYRFEEVPGLDEHIQTLHRLAPDQVVWASDWPHTGGMKHNPNSDPRQEQDFLTPDIPGFLRQCLSYCEQDPELVQKMWVENPRRLWDYTA